MHACVYKRLNTGAWCHAWHVSEQKTACTGTWSANNGATNVRAGYTTRRCSIMYTIVHDVHAFDIVHERCAKFNMYVWLEWVYYIILY